MVLEIPRRRFLRTINSKYIYGRVVSLSRLLPGHVFGDVLSTVADFKNRNAHANTFLMTAPGAHLHLLNRNGHHFQTGSQVQQLLCRPSRYHSYAIDDDVMLTHPQCSR